MNHAHKNELDISVIMPALNEEDNIISAIDNTINAFKDYNLKGELIVVDDGSTDKTHMLVEERMSKDNHEMIRLINHDTPKGLGASFWEGVDRSKGKGIVLLPGDNENDPWEIFRYYDLLKHVDIVIPFVFNREVRPLFRNVLSLIYRFIINSTFLVNFNYTNGTVLYRREVLKKIDSRSMGFFFQTDILIRLVKKHYLFAEVPYRLGRRKHGISRAITFPSLLNVVKGYLKLVRDYYFKKNKKGLVLLSRDSLTFIRRRRRVNDKYVSNHHSG